MLSGWRPEDICNYDGCLHGEEGDRDANRTPECIQLASKLGIRAGMCITRQRNQRSISMK